MPIGKIFHLNKEKGWGFLTSHDVPFVRIYFHWSALIQKTKKFLELNIGDEVEFEVKESEQGTTAIRMKVVNNDQSTSVTGEGSTEGNKDSDK